MATYKSTYVAPDLWMPYAQEAMIAYNDLFATGIVDVSPSSPLDASGEFMTQAYQQSLDNASDVTEIVADNTDVTATAMLDYSIITPVKMYGMGLTEAQYTNFVRGKGSLLQLGSEIGKYFAKQRMAKIVAVIRAMFATGGALLTADHVSNPGTQLTPDTINGARLLFGENMMDLSTIVLHSSIYAEFLNNYAMKEAPLSTLTNNIITTGSFGSWAGIKFLINDTLCAQNTDLTYPCFLFRGSPIYFTNPTPLYETIEYDGSVGGGKTSTFWWERIAYAVKGVSYTDGTYPATDALLATAASWTLKWSTKNVGIVQLNVVKLA